MSVNSRLMTYVTTSRLMLMLSVHRESPVHYRVARASFGLKLCCVSSYKRRRTIPCRCCPSPRAGSLSLGILYTSPRFGRYGLLQQRTPRCD